MAAFIDISLLNNLASIFTFLFIFVLIYALLELSKPFGDGHKGIHAIIAMSVGVIVSISSGVVSVIQTFTPWFTILIIVIFFILFAVRMFGVSEKEITAGFHKGPVLTWLLIFAAVIILFSLGAGFGQQSLEQGQQNGTVTSVATGNTTTPTNTGSFNQNLYNTLFHPKVLGLVLIMLIMVIAMLFLTEADD